MAGRYKIFEELGVGGAGKVFKAYDTQLDRYVAIKRLLTKEEAERDDSQSAAMRKEAASLATLQHPNIVTIFDLGSDEEGTFIVMELLEGDTLADWLGGSTLNLTDFYELASQTLEGIITAHSQSILHRDLKPENIKVKRMPGGRLQAKIVDFGLARLSYGAKKQTEDQRGNVLGSIYYMAPEQFLRRPLDGRTDLYSLGCVYYQALAGRRPFQDPTMAGVMNLHLRHEVVLLHDIRPDLPQQICDWVMWLMNKEPNERPLNVQQALDTLRALHAEGQFVERITGAVPARPASSPVRPITTGITRPATGSISQRITSSAPRGPSGAVPSRSLPAPILSAPPTDTYMSYSRGEPVDDAVPVVVEPEPKKGLPAWIWIALVVLVGGGAVAFFLLRKPAPAFAAGTSAAPTDASGRLTPAKLPVDLLGKDCIIHWSAAEGAVAWSDSGKSDPAENGDNVVMLHDLLPAAGTGDLVAFDRKLANCPKLLVEKVEGINVPLASLNFEAGQGMMHRLEASRPEYKIYPLGDQTPNKGLVFMMLFKPWLLQKEARIVRLHAQDKDDMFDIIATPGDEFKLRARVGGKVKEVKITNRKTAIYSLITLAFDGKTNKVLLNVRGQDGGKNQVTTDVAPGCHTINEVRFSEYSNDPAHPVNDLDKVAGFLSEVMLWPYYMDWEQRSALEQKISEFYFKNPGTRYN